MYSQYLDILSKNALFQGMSQDDISQLLHCLQPKVVHYGKNEYVSLEGDKLEGIGCVLRGEVAVVKENASGNRMIMAMLPPGGIFGEMAAFTLPFWPATVQCTEPCTVLFVPKDKITGSCGTNCRWHTALIENLLRVISKKALMLNKKVEFMAMKTMRGKLCAYFLDQRKETEGDIITLGMKRNELADYLGVSRPSMSREMGRMRDEGLIDFHMASVRLKDLKKIREMAE